MKTLHCVHSIDPQKGGVSTFLKTLSNQATIITLDPPHEQWGAGFQARCIFTGPSFTHYGYNPRVGPRLKAILRNYEAVVIHGLWQYHGLAAAWANRLEPIPLYIMPHGMLDIWFQKGDPIKRLKKYLYWHVAEKYLFQHSQGVFFTSAAEKDRSTGYLRSYTGLQHIIPVGIPAPQKPQYRANYPELVDKRIMLFLGRIDRKKGLDLLVEAWCRLRDHPEMSNWVLALVGPCADPSYANALIQRLNQHHAHFLYIPFAEGEQKWALLRQADFFILPSHQENFGMAVIEALAMGTPVLISDQVNIHSSIIEAHAGLVQPDTLLGTQKLLEDAFTMPLGVHRLYRQAAHRLFDDQFNLDNRPYPLEQALTQMI